VKYNNFSLLQVVDLSDNDFTGTIPRQIFQSPRILFVAIVGGCFHGNFPLEICNATSLKALVLEGLRSGRHCREDFWDPLSVIANRVYRTSTVGKKLPKCIWNLTNLETLYLSGNLMEGSIPETQSLPSSLVRLSLSYNKLTGTIPKILQRQPFEYFDLEHNRLTGTSEDIHISAERYNDTQVTLSVNRLSGHIGNLNYLKHVDVLSGNIYSCSSSRSDLPHNDPESLTYLCGSDALDLTLLFWFLLTVLFVFIVALSLYTIQYRRRFSSSFSDSGGLRRSTLSMLVNFSSPSSLWNKSSERDSEVITCENPLSRVDSNLSSENENERESAVTKNTLQERISDNIHLVLEYHQEISQMNKNSNPELTRFLKTLSSLRMIAIQLGLLAITVFLGFYLIMKLQLDSGTHE
jgi:Leucine-rich repeat (LRR) protein